jgi:hypothetical protein
MVLEDSVKLEYYVEIHNRQMGLANEIPWCSCDLE